VGDIDFEEFFHNGDGLSGRDGLEDGEVHGQRDAGFIVRHFSPGELDGQVGLNAIDGIFGDLKGFTGQRNVNFMNAVAMVFVNVVVAA
jgi:hypothetical protein